LLNFFRKLAMPRLEEGPGEERRIAQRSDPEVREVRSSTRARGRPASGCDQRGGTGTMRGA
jgi:hypothetical protein